MDVRVHHVCLSDERGRGVDVPLFLPVNGYLCLADFSEILVTHDVRFLFLETGAALSYLRLWPRDLHNCWSLYIKLLGESTWVVICRSFPVSEGESQERHKEATEADPRRGLSTQTSACERQ